MQNAGSATLEQAALPYVDYRSSNYRLPAPQIYRRGPAPKPPLAQFILLSMLFHALIVLMFGAPSGGSREGRAMWGSLQVVLLGPPPEPMPALKLDRGVPALKGTSAPRKAPRVPEPRVDRAPGAEPVLRSEPAMAPREEPFTMPPLLDRLVAPELKPQAPPLRVPLPTETPHVPRPLPERKAPEAAEPVQVAPAPVPAPAPAAEVITPPIARPPVETIAIPVPAPPPVERPPVEVPIVPVPAAPSVAPPVERPPVEVPALPVPVRPTAPPKVEPVATPPERPITPEVPITPTPPPTIERVPAPTVIERAPPPPTTIERAPLPPPVERAAPRTPEVEPPRRAAPEPPVPAAPAPSTSPLPSPTPEFPRGRDAPPGTYDPTAPSIDLDAARKRAGQLAREGTGRRAVLPFPMPPVPERKTKEQIAIEKARKPDCRTAYQDLGLLAVAPLIANQFGEGTCRW